ncbi:MAG: AAA family ATPase [Alphaproteobacteria bacterium]|jgi:pilus assembly protein CpaE|nr:AAA family ATPase [Alphaproteobacteria bacterium]
MGKESALFDADLDFEIEEEFARHSDDPGEPAGSIVDEDVEDILSPLSPQAPQKEVGQGEVVLPDVTSEGGDRPIPAISIMAFVEQPDTVELLGVVRADRRIGRATMEVAEGGLDTAMAYLAENSTPNLLIVESHAPAQEMIAQIDELAEHCDEGVEVMVIGETNDITLYRQLMARGVSEYVVPPFNPLQIIRSISDLFTDPEAPFVGKSIAVAGAKGGVGASTIAHNLAWSLAENAGFNATLVDLDISFGTTALDFNHDNQQTVVDALLDPDRADDAVIGRLLAKATDRLSLFTAPASVADDVPEIDADAYAKVIETVRRNVPWLVLDLPHIWSPWVSETLVGADEVIMVCQPDLASLRNGKNMIDYLAAKRPNDLPPKIVLNMTGIPKRPEIPVKDFAQAMGLEPAIILPFDPQLFGTASNNGQMISETDPAARPSQAVDHLASLLTGQTVAQRRKSLIDKVLGR